MTLGPLLVALLALPGCGLLGGEEAPDTSGADAKLSDGDIAGATAAYEAILVEHPGSVDAALGAAYGAYLSGDFEKSESVLAAAEAAQAEDAPPENAKELRMRRALVALATGDTDAVREHAQATGMPAGMLLVAEVALADGERDEAVRMLNEISGTSGVVGDAAKQYLELLEDEDPLVAGLAENYALWALGQRRVAAVSVEEVVKGMPDDRERKAEELLLWAGRAASVGESLVAANLLGAISFPPAGQKWRVDATQAIILCSEGGGEGEALESANKCLEAFNTLAESGGAPADGLDHAKITAAMLLGDKNAEVSAALLADVSKSDGAAIAAIKAGDADLARSLAPEGLLSDML